MTLLHLLSYAGAIATFLFVTLSLASGLLWLAELIEEHSKTAKTIGIRAIYAIIALHVLLYLIDGLPLALILFSIVAHIIYLQNFTATWPFISLTSTRFLGSCCMVVADHFLWFFYFAEKAQEAKRYNSSSRRFRQAAGGKVGPTFMDVAAFFAVCVWFVPLFLFLSLSANDNVLPQMDQAPGTPSGLGRTVDLTVSPRALGKIDTSGTYDYFSSPSQGRTSLLKSVLAPVLSLIPGISLAGRSGRRQHPEGIIAPRTPASRSPLPSPRIESLALPSRQGSASPFPPWGDDLSSSGSGFITPSIPPSPSRRATGLSAPQNGSINQRRASPINALPVPAGYASPSSTPVQAHQPGPPRRTPSEAAPPSSQIALGAVARGDAAQDGGMSMRRAVKGKDD